MKTIGRDEFVLAGDIGGAKTNLALFSPNKERPVRGIPVRVILNDKAALLGAACCASDLLAYQGRSSDLSEKSCIARRTSFSDSVEPVPLPTQYGDL
jgi:hypothetical protein